MLTGDELREARERAGLTQQQLGDQVGKAMRSVGNWERAPRVPDAAERLVRRAFPDWFGAPAAPLSTVSDAQLLAEIARRFERGRQDGDVHGRQPAPRTTPADSWRDHMDKDGFDLAADRGEPERDYSSQEHPQG